MASISDTVPETTSAVSTPFIPGWTSHPIPNFTLSAAGLLALADLSTLAQRTALRGGSSWLDSLLLVPGLHYQQAADELARGEGAHVLTAVEVGRDGVPTSHRIVNQAVVNYLLRTAKEGRTVVLDVGEVPVRPRSWGSGRGTGQRAMLYGGAGGRGGIKKTDEDGGLSGAANLLYLASPVLTCMAIALVVLLQDWWALALVLGLMISRILNIFVIKSRSRPKPAVLPAPFPPQPLSILASPPPRITQYTVTLGPATTVILRGLSTDLYALTTTVWLRPKTHVEGYLEATAKMLVYVVAAVSGNATQAGNIVLLALLLVSAGLLALSNARTTDLRNGGRVVAPCFPEGSGGGTDARAPMGAGATGRRRERHQRSASAREDLRPVAKMDDDDESSWPGSSEASSMMDVEDSLEKGRASRLPGRMFPSDGSVDPAQLKTRIRAVEAAALRVRPNDASQDKNFR